MVDIIDPDALGAIPILILKKFSWVSVESFIFLLLFASIYLA